MKVFLLASLTIASALVVERSKPDLLAKKLSDIEDTWVQQSKTFFHSYQFGDPYGKTGEGHRMREDFRAQCKEGASKLISIGTVDSVNKYFAPVCQHMQGWHKDLCGKMHGLVVSHMVEDAADNRKYAANNAFLVCHDMWWHLMTALKAATHRTEKEHDDLAYSNPNSDVDRAMQHYRVRKTQEPGVTKGEDYRESPTL